MGVITLMGSGETSPTMVKVHRRLLERTPDPLAVFVDTPFGFQANADDITEKVTEFFATSLNTELHVASLRSADRATEAEKERMLEACRQADYLFSGPGSPSYALRHWGAIGFAGVVSDVLAAGGAVTLASAAAVTAGAVSLPVYEIYKVGEDPRWLAGLDALSAFGVKAAVIPHFDNAEGGSHDTRYCYMGQARFDYLRGLLDDDTVIVGVDEHTALILDSSDFTAQVVGRGEAHLLLGDSHRRIAAGPPVSLADSLPRETARLEPDPPAHAQSSRLQFEEAMAARDAEAAVDAVLEAEGSPEFDRSQVRGMIVRLGAAAESGLTDPRLAVGGYVDTLLELRSRARAGRRWDEADYIRDRLAELGVSVTDTEDGVEWDLT